MKLIKFLAIILLLGAIYMYVPYGPFICMGVNIVAIWKLVNG